MTVSLRLGPLAFFPKTGHLWRPQVTGVLMGSRWTGTEENLRGQPQGLWGQSTRAISSRITARNIPWSLRCPAMFLPQTVRQIQPMDGQTPPHPTAQPWCNKASRTFGKGSGCGRDVLGLSDQLHLLINSSCKFQGGLSGCLKLYPVISLLDAAFPKI